METLTLFALIIGTLAATTIVYYYLVHRPVEFMDTPTTPRTSERVEVAHEHAARALTRNIESPDREEVALAGAVLAETPVFMVAFEKPGPDVLLIKAKYYENGYLVRPLDLALRHPYAVNGPTIGPRRFSASWVANEVNKAIDNLPKKAY